MFRCLGITCTFLLYFHFWPIIFRDHLKKMNKEQLSVKGVKCVSFN